MIKTISAFVILCALTSAAQAQTGVVTGTMQEMPTTTVPMSPPPQPTGVYIIQGPSGFTGGTVTGSLLPSTTTPLIWGGNGSMAIRMASKEEGGGDAYCRTLAQNGLYFVGRYSVIDKKMFCIYAAGGQEVRSERFDFLSPDGRASQELITKAQKEIKWVPVINNQLPPSPLLSAKEPGRGLPVCRTNFEGQIRGGWVGNGGCNVTSKGRGVSVGQYQAIALGGFVAVPQGPVVTQPQQPQQPQTPQNPMGLHNVFNLEPGRTTP